MQIDADKIILDSIREGLRDGIKGKLTNYNSTLSKTVDDAIEQNKPALTTLVSDAVKTALSETSFRESVIDAVRSQMSKTLISKIGGEIEKQVNALKSDPTTRARITLALDEIVRSKS